MTGANPSLTLHTSLLSEAQATRLKDVLEEQGWHFEKRPYMLFFAQRQKVNVAVYEKGPKIVVQGKGTAEFVEFILEPQILGQAQVGYEEVNHPEMFAPHIGIDESGKGDFFGPLVIAGCYTDREITRKLKDAGVQDSKSIGSDARIRALAETIRTTPGIATTVVMIGPVRYNALYEKFGNLNELLAWGHARAIENLLEQRPDCPRALSDQFGNPRLIERALMDKGQKIELQQRTKAESDTAVAAASILARERFIEWLRKTGKEYSVEMPRGASALVKKVACDLVKVHGNGILANVAKCHFKTAAEILGMVQEKA